MGTKMVGAERAEGTVERESGRCPKSWVYKWGGWQNLCSPEPFKRNPRSSGAQGYCQVYGFPEVPCLTAQRSARQKEGLPRLWEALVSISGEWYHHGVSHIAV